MSARDAESGSSTYKGGSGYAGGIGNGGVGGGMGGGGNWGGGWGGGGGMSGGYGNRTGLNTGNTMFGGMAFGRPGGMAMNPGAWGIHPQAPVAQNPLGRPAQPGVPTPASLPGVNPPAPSMPPAIGFLPGWPGTGQWWGNQAPWNNNAASWPSQPAPAGNAYGPRMADNSYNGYLSSVRNTSPMNDPSYGFGSASGNTPQGYTGPNYGGPNGMKTW